MTRGLGTALAFSIAAHGGAVATVAIVGVAWLGGPPAIPTEAALFVDLVEAVVATSDRIGAADAPAAGPRSVPTTGPGAARPWAPTPRREREVDVAPRMDTSPTSSQDRSAAIDQVKGAAPDVPPPPLAPVPAEPRAPRVAASPETLPSAPPVAAAAPPSPSRRPDPPATRELPGLPPPVTASSVPEPAASSAVTGGASSDPLAAGPAATGSTAIASRSPAGPEAGPTLPSGAGGHSVAQPVAPSGSATPGAGSHGVLDVARLAPGGGGIPPEYESYVRSLRERVEGRLVYPWMAARRGQQGVVELELRVSAEGRLVGVEVMGGSSVDALRTAAVGAVRGAAPFPFPAGVQGRPLVIRLPVEFRLR